MGFVNINGEMVHTSCLGSTYGEPFEYRLMIFGMLVEKVYSGQRPEMTVSGLRRDLSPTIKLRGEGDPVRPDLARMDFGYRGKRDEDGRWIYEYIEPAPVVIKPKRNWLDRLLRRD